MRPLESDLMLLCDQHLIRQALAKLIDNAIKFSPQGETVEIWGHATVNGEAVMSVRDHGPGLNQAKLKDCIQPFVQGNMSYARPAEGLGLGLPIAKAICEAHGGELAVQTAPGQGLVAAVVLPRSLVLDRAPMAELKSG
jgi:signal transduction histidine kinase